MQYFLISEGWLRLKPNVDNNGNLEDFEKYYMRNSFFFSHIPKDVLKQWIHPLHGDYNSLLNYAWINYWKDEVEFKLEEWAPNQFKDIYVLERARDYFETKSSYNDWNEFALSNRDIEYWKENGTWSLPPVILDCNSYIDRPKGVEIAYGFQLIEDIQELGF